MSMVCDDAVKIKSKRKTKTIQIEGYTDQTNKILRENEGW